MAVDRTLTVVEHPTAAPPDVDELFVIESALAEVPATEFDDVFRTVSEAELDSVGDLPLYSVARLPLAFVYEQNKLPPIAITHLILLYRLLDRRLREGDIAAIDCGKVGENYRAVVSDVAAKHHVLVEGSTRIGFLRVALGFLRGLWGYALVIVDQLFSLFWKRRFGRIGRTDTVFVPHVNRFDSTRPVLDELEAIGHDHLVVLPLTTLYWLRYRDGRYADVAEYDPVPLNYFASPTAVLETIRRGVRMAFGVLFHRSFDRALCSFVEEEFGVSMPNTIGYALGNLLPVHVPSLANTVVAERMIEELDPDRLVVGSLGSRQQAILYAAIDAGLDTYHVPHSATTGYELAPPPGTVHFVPGEHVVDHLRETGQLSDVSSVVPAGRPQLVALSGMDVSPRTDWRSGAIRIVIATQPFPDRIRRRFVADVLDAIAVSLNAVDVIVKIHPNESASFYADIVGDRSLPVRIVEEDLYGYVTGADVVVTVNSNVGLESIVLGTSCVCVNEWSPLIRARPYAHYGPVPVLASPDELAEFFGTLDRGRIEELTLEESAFVEEFYLSDPDAARTIAEIIATDRVPDVAVEGGVHSR